MILTSAQRLTLAHRLLLARRPELSNDGDVLVLVESLIYQAERAAENTSTRPLAPVIPLRVAAVRGTNVLGGKNG